MLFVPRTAVQDYEGDEAASYAPPLSQVRARPVHLLPPILWLNSAEHETS
jgi:hypothetical protein